MVRRLQRACSLILVLGLAISLLSISTFAAEEDTGAADTEIETLQENLKAARETLSAAQETQAEKQAAYDAAAAEVSDDALNEAQSARDGAQQIYDDALMAQGALPADASEEDKAAAQGTVDSAKNDLDKAESDLKTARDQYQAQLDALPASGELKSANQAVAEAQQAVDDAQDALDNANKALAAPVIEAINAIAASGFEDNYQGKTSEQKQTVIDARAAYDALSDDAKAQVTNYAALTEAERYLNGHSYDGTSQWDYTGGPIQSTSEGILSEVDEQTNTVTYTIPADYSGNSVYFNIYADAMDALDGTYMPGDSAPFTIKIVNLSGKTFGYVKDSFKVYTEDVTQFVGTDKIYSTASDGTMVDAGYIAGATGFDGLPIYYSYDINRTGNLAIQALYGVRSTSLLHQSQLSDEGLGQKLKDAGYENGIADLAAYYLDYYNAKYHTSAEKLEDLPDAAISSILSGNRFNIRETCVEVAELGYNVFYNRCLSVIPADVSGLNTADYSVGALMRGEAKYESYCEEAFAGVETGGTYTLHPFIMTLDYYLISNAYMDFNFSWYPVLELSRTDTSYTVEGNYYTSTDGGAYVKDNSEAVSLQGAVAGAVGDQVTVTPDEAWTSYSGSQYQLDEKQVLSLIMAVDPADNVLTLNYYRTVNNGGGGGGNDDPTTPSNPTTPPTEIKDPETPLSGPSTVDTEVPEDGTPTADLPEDTVPLAAVPKTGDTGNLWLALAGASALGLAAVTVAFRKKERE